MLLLEKSHRLMSHTNRWFRLLIVLPLLGTLIPVTGYSVELKHLYDVQIPVESRDRAELEDAFRQALVTVLVRVTGKSTIAGRAEVIELLKNPSRFVQQYRYYEQGDESPPKLNLWIHFDGVAMEKQLMEAGMPVWGKERPAVLIWFAIERQGKRFLMGEDSDSQAREALADSAKQAGIPLVFPLLDLEDRVQVNVSDVFGGFAERLLRASRRYNPDAVLIAWASGTSDGFWKTHWRLDSGAETRDWNSVGADFVQVLENGIGRLAGELSKHLAVSSHSGERDSVLLMVSGVDTLEGYARIASYLTGLDRISRFRPYRIEPGRISFWLQLRGSPGDLERLIALGGILDKTAAPNTVTPSVRPVAASGSSPALILYYQLLP